MYELAANCAIALMLTVLITAAFTGSFYGARADKEAYAPIYRGSTDEKEISLMINVYWGTEYVLPMAQILRDYGFSTTFFIEIGRRKRDIIKNYAMGLSWAITATI